MNTQRAMQVKRTGRGKSPPHAIFLCAVALLLGSLVTAFVGAVALLFLVGLIKKS